MPPADTTTSLRQQAISGVHHAHRGRGGAATKEAVHTSCLVKRDAKHQAKTAHRVSPGYFCGGPDDEQEGEGQGIIHVDAGMGTAMSIFKLHNRHYQ